MARNPTRQQIEAVEALLAGAEKQIREAFLSAVYAARGRVDLGALIDALERRDIEAAVEMLRFDQSLLWPLEEAVRGTFLQGGASVAGSLPAGLQGRFGFNGRHPRAEAIIRQIGAALVTAVEQEQIEAVRLVMTDAMETNRPAREVALDITGRMNRFTRQREGGIIGLTSQQTDWVINSRRDLNTLDERYFTRALRDKRYDATVRKAIKDGKPLAAADVDRIVNRYKDRMLDYRGKIVARNEAFSAQAAGRHEAYQQMLDMPEVATITKRWIHGFSREPREDHKAMNGTVLRFDEDFVMSDGARMAYPHDPRGGAKHSISCKCTVFYRAVPRKD